MSTITENIEPLYLLGRLEQGKNHLQNFMQILWHDLNNYQAVKNSIYHLRLCSVFGEKDISAQPPELDILP